jgi:hypothetical protein
LSGHFHATHDRMAAADGPILILHDTTEFVYYRESAQALGALKKGLKGRAEPYAVRGVLMHSSLAVTTEGLPLGLTAIKFWSRSKFKGTNALKRSVNPTRVPIEEKESIRWLENLKHSTELLGEARRCVHIGDRESDIYELFCTAEQSGTNFLLGTCVDRLAGDGQHTIAAAMRNAKVKATYRVEVRDAKGTMSEATVDVRYPTPGSAANRQTEKIPLPDVDGDSRPGADKTERPRKDRLEADHKSFCPVAQRRIRKAHLVCDAMEDRDVPQNPEVRL